MKQYNVIWFDDEHEQFEVRKDQARQKGIMLFGYNNAEDGIAELETNFLFYDAAIVDGKFYKSSRNTGDTVDNLALSSVARFLDKLENKKKIPWFILSGQMEFVTGINDIAIEYKNNKVYNKNFSKDYDQLWLDIINEADKQPETQIKHKYKAVFDVCSSEFIGESSSKYLVDILHNIEFPNEKFDDEKYFNGLRKVVELVFRACNKLGLLHDGCIVNGIVNLTGASLFMAGKELELKKENIKIKTTKTHFPLILANNVKSILDITSAASHTEEEKENGKVNFAEYKKSISSNFLLYSLAYQVMDLILWYKEYSILNANNELNKSYWVESVLVNKSNENEWILGKVIRIAENGYGTFQTNDLDQTLTIVPFKVKEFNLVLDQQIEVLVKQEGNKTLINSIRTIN
jgi:hypothetical protein